MVGCSLLDDDIEIEEAETIIQTQAPQAEFSVSTQSGKVPLQVMFSDLSQQGSADITTWRWDFGDGNTSDEQNPQHSFLVAGNYSVSLTVTSVDGSDTQLKTDYVEVSGADIQLRLSVVDVKGKLLDNLSVSSDSFQIESDSVDELGVLLNLRPNANDGVVKVSKAGYLDGVVYLNGLFVNDTRQVTLAKKADPIIFDATNGGRFFGRDGAGVDIPAEALRRSDGSIAIGETELYITPINTSDEIEVNAFPGSFFGTTAIGEEQDELFSYGVVDVTFEQNGEELQLVEDEVALLTLPLYADKTTHGEDLSAGDIIPLWYLDEASGLWLYESEGTVVENPMAPYGFSLQATTSHFTSFNSDINPPGLGRGGSGGGNNLGDFVCTLNLDLLGGDVGETYKYELRYFIPRLPSSGRPRVWQYDGSSLRHNIARGYAINATVKSNDKEGSSTFGCGNDNEIFETITLGDQPPEFKHWDFAVEPQFTLDNDNRYEITSNSIFVGGYFVGADAVTVTSSILDTPLILGRSIYREVEYLPGDGETIAFDAKLVNDFGEVSRRLDVAYVDEAPPIIGYSYAFVDNISGSFPLTVLHWVNVRGADHLRVYELGQDPESTGSLILDSVISPDSQVYEFPGEIAGFLRLEFENQYGMTPEIIEIGSADCLPDSENCPQ